MSAYPYKLAASLARPVARGYLSQDDAEDSLLVTALRSRSGHDPLDVYRIARHILAQKLADMHARRELAAHHIKRLLEPMIALHKPSRALLAEAHGVNGEEGFPLGEDEVTELATLEMHRATTFQRRPTHVR
jgi:hypothetical protein